MYLLSTGYYLPGGSPVTNDMLAEVFGSPIKLIGEYLGVNSRYLTVDYKTGKARDGFNSDFCFKASEDALAKISMEPNKIDLIVSTTVTPDTALPQTSALVQEKLGIKSALTFDIRGGCSLPIQGMLLAESFINNGLAENVLLVGSECCSTIYYEYLLKNTKDFLVKDIMSALMFGDGASACILSKNNIGKDSFLVEKIKSASSFVKWPPGFVFSIGGSKMKYIGESEIALGNLIKQSPKNVEKYMPKVIECILEEIDHEGYDIADFKNIIGPQATKRLISRLNKLFNKPQSPNYVYYGDFTGNIPGCALLLAFNKLCESSEFKRDEKILIMGIESPKWVYGYCILRKV
jgi:3-oxoacyl-[acyl-carrier-protein] synthase III